jgi:hypothetical protein
MVDLSPEISRTMVLKSSSSAQEVSRLKYIADYVVTHRGNKHSGCLVLRGEDTPKIGDVLDVRIAGHPLPVQIESVDLRKEAYGVQHASLVCSTYTL